MTSSQQSRPDTMPQPAAIASSRRTITIGLPKCLVGTERRFPITPECAGMLEEMGLHVRMEAGAASTIHYTDTRYAKHGVEICTRTEALAADIVIYLASLPTTDICHMRRGATLFTLFSASQHNPDTLRRLLDRGVTAIALDLITDPEGHFPIADILAEIDGRAAVSRAASLLADADHGKGILLGGVPGVVPCEVTIIGSGISAQAAARSACGVGAVVRMFDTDIYSLRCAQRLLGSGVIASTLRQRGLQSALRTADVVIATPAAEQPTLSTTDISLMKTGVVIFDLNPQPGHVFPSLPTIDLAQSRPIDIAPDTPQRVAYVNAGSLVPRTAAMALSDALILILRQISHTGGSTQALRAHSGLRTAAFTFMGKPVHADIARLLNQRHVDINIYLSLS